MTHNKILLALGLSGSLAILITVFLISRCSFVGEPKTNQTQNLQYSSSDQIEHKVSRCTTSGCQTMASYLANSIDYATKPCDDFYQFACGRAIERAKLDGSSNSNISIFDEAPKKVEAQLKQLLEDSLTFPDHGNRNLIRLRQYYKSCMNEGQLARLGIEPFRRLIQRLASTGGLFPILGPDYGWLARVEAGDNWLQWLNLLIAFRNKGISENFFVSLSIRPNYLNNTLATIYLEQPTLDMKDMLSETIEDDRRSDYRFMLASLQALGIQFNHDVQLQLDDIYKFKTKLINIMSSKDMLKVNHTMIRLSHFKLLDLRRNFYEDYVIQMMNRTDLRPDQEIEVDLDYLFRLDKLMAETRAEVILNFMFYKLVHQLRNYLLVVQPPPDSWTEDKNCLAMVQEDLTLGLSHEYIKHFVNEDTRQRVINLVERIKREAKGLIDQAEWIKAPETRSIAKEKVDSIKIMVAYASQLMNESLIESMQDSLVFDEDQFLENYLKITSNDYVREYEKFGQDMVDSNWEISSLTTESNAFYMLQFNSIVIYAGIMILRFFDPTRIEYLNIGSLGSLIGHEITHAFDPQGSQFDKFGNKLKATWWDKQTLVGFERNQKCFINKYDNLPIVPGPINSSGSGERGHKLNSTFTLGENMADNGGFQVAHQAYKQWVKEQELAKGKANVVETVLPGLDFTQDQLFWLSLASLWCNHDESGSAMHSNVMGKLDNHSPAKYRVNIPLSNAKQFSEAFECEVGSFMNPREKCVVW